MEDQTLPSAAEFCTVHASAEHPEADATDTVPVSESVQRPDSVCSDRSVVVTIPVGALLLAASLLLASSIAFTSAQTCEIRTIGLFVNDCMCS
jgi:hypothetical protein